MKWRCLKVVFDAADEDMAMELIADAFAEAGVTGVVIEDPREQPADPVAPGESVTAAHFSVSGYFHDDADGAGRADRLRSRIRELEAGHRFRCRILQQTVNEEDWAESWKAYFWPERITEQMVVKPSWRDYHARPGERVIVIDPGMAFGTGTHPTTALCLALLEQYIRPGHRFLDVGTGSGILMVAAAMLGATSGLGIDHDPVAVAVARENLRRNAVDAYTFAVRSGDLARNIDGPVDVVTANILSHVVIELLDHLPAVMADGAVLIASGITTANVQKVEEKMVAVGLSLETTDQREDWAAVVGRKPAVR